MGIEAATVYFKAESFESFEGQPQWSDILAKGRRDHSMSEAGRVVALMEL